ncbi:hypothetical protein BBJ28_00012664 [Nothophytophthora sp. Chile5]|nr:hypothetical protein BBJ28_00012664 [Nothophytophthora sp. Chile5]
MLHLQCLLSATGLEEEAPLARVLAVAVSPSERVAVLQARIATELRARKIERGGGQPSAAMQLYCVQQQRLTYRLDQEAKREVLFLDGTAISGCDASSSAVLGSTKRLVPWAHVSWYFREQPFVLPDAVDVVVAWEEDFVLV